MLTYNVKARDPVGSKIENKKLSLGQVATPEPVTGSTIATDPTPGNGGMQMAMILLFTMIEFKVKN